MVAAKAAAAAAGKVAGSKTARIPADLPADPGAHVAKLRGQGMDDAQIRGALKTMGYSPASADNVAPGQARTKRDPSDLPVNSSADPRPAPATPAPAATQPRSAPPRSMPSPDIGSGGVAGFALGLVATAVLINFMRGGPDQVKRWAKAKFLNVTTGAPGDTFPGGSTKTPSQRRDPKTGSNVPVANTAATAAFWGQW
jgi:hypothetical protein